MSPEELLGVDQVELELPSARDKQAQEGADPESTRLAMDLSVELVRFKGVRRALDPPLHGPTGQVAHLERGFFGQDFIIEQLGGATSNIDIITGRTLS